MQNPWYTLFFKAKSLEHFKAKSREHFIFTEKSFKIFTFDFFYLLDEAQFCEGQVPLTPVTWNWQLQQLPSLYRAINLLYTVRTASVHETGIWPWKLCSKHCGPVGLLLTAALLPSSLSPTSLPMCVCVWGGGGGQGGNQQIAPIKRLLNWRLGLSLVPPALKSHPCCYL